MEARLVIFLGFVAVTLIINTAIIFFAYKALANVATKLTDSVHEFQTITLTRERLSNLHAASVRAVKVTSAVKGQIVGFESTLEEMHLSYRQKLAMVDENMKFAARAIHFTAEKAEKIVKWPIRNVNAVAAAIQGIVNSFRGSQSGADARSRRNR